MKRFVRTINLENKKLLGHGLYARVWRISKGSVVKVYNPNLGRALLPLMWDEIRGSKRIKHALPIRGIATIVLPDGTKSIGLVKKYIPHRVTNYGEFNDMLENGEFGNSWDIHNENVRIDEKKRYWVTDTQTGAVGYIQDRLNVNPWSIKWPDDSSEGSWY